MDMITTYVNRVRILALSADTKKEYCIMTQQNGEAPVSPGDGDQRRYDLAGDGVQIQFTSTHIKWPIDITTLSFSYQGPDGNGTFSGEAIRSQTGEIGTLLTVTLPNNKETLREEKITLSVLLPDVHPTGSPEWTANIKTVAILTTSIGMTMGTSSTGQVQTYRVYELDGTLTFTILPHRVTLNVGAASYQVGEPMSVTLSNHSAQTISFINLKS